MDYDIDNCLSRMICCLCIRFHCFDWVILQVWGFDEWRWQARTRNNSTIIWQLDRWCNWYSFSVVSKRRQFVDFSVIFIIVDNDSIHILPLFPW